MPNSTDKIVAALEALLKKKGTQKPTDRLGLERPVFSRDLDNRPMAGWEKAAALLGAAVSPGSTIASMVLAPPAEETLFDRAIKGPDGKTQYPQVSESVVPRMRKAARKSVTPNPIVTALQRALQKGPIADPANDLLHQKINDRDFLVHATRPEKAKTIRELGGILPSGTFLPEKVLDDPVIRKMLSSGEGRIFRSPFSGGIELETPAGVFKMHKNQKTGIVNIDPDISPGVSMSRQLVVPDLGEDKNYRFLLNPKDRKTFPTAEPGFKKAGVADTYKHLSADKHESEQRTFGTPYPVKPANRALTTNSRMNYPTEERVDPRKVDRYRATMGNETVKTIFERLGVNVPSKEEKKLRFQEAKAVTAALWDKLQAAGLSKEYSELAVKWEAAHKKQMALFDDIYK